ncbi:ArsR/SmtB family transcription factor [Peribacillus frigoritolerans]|uniref:ArsR/SmtB family transcription factor n=1 Tax=Peribacillus frigoritolerans TaxID=450367 RepID=UPI0007BF3D98|nr:metalloregulator ArsR/SmtB family transcription factor [Peribacillus frigoritolerans]
MVKTIIEITRLSQLLKLLGDKTRLTIVSILKQRECCVCELNEVFDMSQPAISQHLRKLKDFGTVKEERKGQWIFYSLNQESDLYTLLEDILVHVPDQTEKIRQIENNPTLRCGC